MDGEAVTRLPGRAETPQHGQGSSGTVLGVTGGEQSLSWLQAGWMSQHGCSILLCCLQHAPESLT